MFIHPHVSTVIYLTSIGAPTLAISFRVNNLTGQYMIPGQARQKETLRHPMPL
jgi:hypothetical protein